MQTSTPCHRDGSLHVTEQESVEVSGVVVHQGFRRGCCELTVTNLSSLQEKQAIESNVFEICGLKWELVVWRGFRNGFPPEMMNVLLLSANVESVSADVYLNFASQRKKEGDTVKRKPKVALPFSRIERHSVRLDDLLNSDGSSEGNDSFVVVVDLKNIRLATEKEQGIAKINLSTVKLEVMTRQSISRTLEKRSPFMILPSDRRRYSDVSNRSFTHLWAREFPECRCWL